MSKTSKAIIFAASVILIIGLTIFYMIYSSSTRAVPDGVIGNTAGNLNNDGLFCESDGMVYFSNPYDDGALYSMKPDGSDLKKLSDLGAKWINAGGNYIFFYGTHSKTQTGLGSVITKPAMYRVKKEDGGSLTALTKDVSQDMILYGNKIYYQHYTEKNGTTFAVVDLKSKESTELLDFMINPSNLYQGQIYYNGMYDDHFLYSYDIVTGAVNTIWEGDIWNPIYDGNYVYYMDVLNNYRLCRYSIPNNTIEILTEDRVDFFNLYGDYIYYQKNSKKEPALKRMRADGSEEEIVASGNYSNVNITSTYTYFTAFGTDYPLYFTPTFGAINVTEFTKARDAIVLK